MSPLEHPDAQALPADAVVTPDEVRGCQDRITTSLGSRSWSVCAPGGKPPAVTVSQVREVISRLLRSPAPSPERIAAVVRRVLRREEAARIDKGRKATGESPPRRPRPDTS